MAYDTSVFLAAVKRRAFVPTTQGTFAATETLAVATEELHSYLAPLVMEVRQEHFVTVTDVPLVSGQALYRIPARALGGKLRDVLALDSGGCVRNLTRLEPEAGGLWRAGDTGEPAAFSLQGNYVRLHPTPTGTGTLRLSYFGRPGALVETSAAGRVEAVDYAAGTLTLSGAAPASFVPGVRLDVVGAQPGFSTIATELTLSSSAPDGDGDAVLTFAALPVPPSVPLEYPVTAPEEISVGDWVCLAGEAPVPQVPPELHPLLALKTAAAQLEAIGDVEAARTLLMELAEKQKRALALLSPRTEGEPRRVANGMGQWRGVRRLY